MNLEQTVSNEALYLSIRDESILDRLAFMHNSLFGFYNQIPDPQPKPKKPSSTELKKTAYKLKLRSDSYLGIAGVELPEVRFRSFFRPASQTEMLSASAAGFAGFSILSSIVTSYFGMPLFSAGFLALGSAFSYISARQYSADPGTKIVYNNKGEKHLIILQHTNMEEAQQGIAHEYAHALHAAYSPAISLKKEFSAFSEGFARMMEWEISYQTAIDEKNPALIKGVLNRIIQELKNAILCIRKDIHAGKDYSNSHILNELNDKPGYCIGTSAFILAKEKDEDTLKKTVRNDYTPFIT